MENKNIVKLKNEFNQISDLIIKKTLISRGKYIYVAFLESVCSSDKINDYILKTLSSIKINKVSNIKNLASYIAAPNINEFNTYDKIEFFITNGFAIIINDIDDNFIAVETRADLNRGISTPDSQPAIIGPKDAFNENFQVNLGLIKRRIKSHNLMVDDLFVGRKTNTKVGVLYLNDIAEEKLVSKVKQKINAIDTDGIIDSGYISQFINDENKTPFPLINSTERPDIVATALLEGKIAILVDSSPFVLVIPTFLIDFINPIGDNYEKSINVNMVKFIRFFCFLITIIMPAVYIAIINYNQETIPTSLLVNFSIQRDMVPFPAFVESIVLLFICEILREADIRFPSSYGSAISILGALIVGDAAVSAGLVSPIMIIVIAITFITSLMFTDLEIIGAMRYFRLLFLISAGVFGLFGVILAAFYFLIHITSISSFGKPYFYPIAPYDLTYMKKTLFKSKRRNDKKRSSFLTRKNFTKQGDFK